jgi:stage V sporulation protein G
VEITEVRVRLRNDDDKKLKAYATVTFDNAFVVRDLKIIEGKKGLFVAMPSRKAQVNCSECNFRNPMRSRFCNHCGKNIESLTFKNDKTDLDNIKSEHRDIAHPITSQAREYIQDKILKVYKEELDKTGQSDSAA